MPFVPCCTVPSGIFTETDPCTATSFISLEATWGVLPSGEVTGSAQKRRGWVCVVETETGSARRIVVGCTARPTGFSEPLSVFAGLAGMAVLAGTNCGVACAGAEAWVAGGAARAVSAARS